MEKVSGFDIVAEPSGHCSTTSPPRPGIKPGAGEAPVEGNRIAGRQAGDETTDIGVGHVQVKQFVRIAMQQPVEPIELTRGFQHGHAMLLREAPLGNLVAQMRDRGERGQPVGNQVGAIVAIIGQHDGPVEAERQIMRDPFDEEGPLVLHTGGNGELRHQDNSAILDRSSAAQGASAAKRPGNC